MLSLEYLIEEAKNNNLPLLKKRAILREYLQVIILNSIYHQDFGRSMYFTGGTALRFFYNMPRFSEDLDFDTPDLKFEAFRKMLEYIKKGLLKEGFSVEISSEERNNLYIAELYFKDLVTLYGITDKRGHDLMIKIETYKPSWHIESESDVLSLYGYNFSCLLLDKARLFSEKLCALFNRRRGRDIYDTLFLLKRRFGIDENVLAANNIKGLPKELILGHLKSLSEKDLKYLANQVKPFLFKEEDIELVLKAPIYAEKFLKEYKSHFF
ncbi:MAG: nucleotidyl transferase AbiEii/AbiGii toxin family protein [Candidatus Omnitrophica bacterium]|nr:nucleotidyl transferase AbiEii/AbiGii toxin family protein [Candidatus Omnitrophota bacterium]